MRAPVEMQHAKVQQMQMPPAAAKQMQVAKMAAAPAKTHTLEEEAPAEEAAEETPAEKAGDDSVDLLPPKGGVKGGEGKEMKESIEEVCLCHSVSLSFCVFVVSVSCVLAGLLHVLHASHACSVS